MADEKKNTKTEDKKELSLEERKKKNRKLIFILIVVVIGFLIVVIGLCVLCVIYGSLLPETEEGGKKPPVEVKKETEEERLERDTQEEKVVEEIKTIEDISVLITKKPFEVYDLFVSKYGDSFPKEIKEQVEVSYKTSGVLSRAYATWYIRNENYEVDIQLNFEGDNTYLKSSEVGDFVIHYEDFDTTTITENDIPKYLKMFGLERENSSYSLETKTFENILFVDLFLK